MRKICVVESKVVRDKMKVNTHPGKPLSIKKQSDNDRYDNIWQKWQEQAPSHERNSRQYALKYLRDCLHTQNTYLNLTGLHLSSIPILPPHIKKLGITRNQLKELPPLPVGLEELNCAENRFITLSGLPSGIKKLDCSRNGLVNLSVLPEGLKQLNCSNNRLKSLPALPTKLKILNCSGNHLDTLPILPNELIQLNCSKNNFAKMCELPERLQVLNCSKNHLESLPMLSAELNDLTCTENRLVNLPELPVGLNNLICTANRLVNLPELPNRLKKLDCSQNNLVNLNSLPSSLEEFSVHNNGLTELPELPATLRLLNCNHNRLERLPNLPCSITEIEVNHNQLSELPELPVSLEMLLCAHNQITHLPESIAYQENSFGILDIRHNPLSERIIQNFIALNNDQNYRGIRIYFSMPSQHTSEHSVRQLTESVPDWFSDEHKQEIISKYAVITNEENAGAFSAFIDRLHKTRSAEQDPKFKQHISQWLTRLADSPDLREASFVVALGATESCEDRVALTWNDMKKIDLIHNIETGQYDNKLPELVTVGREMFRLGQLEHIAREKVTTLRFVDEIEVYLGFQTQLQIPLELANTTKEMRFFGVSGITESDLNIAEIKVKIAENQQFAEWLVQWSPWQKFVERTEPTLWEQAYDKKMDIYENEYQSRINAELAANGLSGDADAERALGIKIMHDIDNTIFTALTQNVLASKKHTSLLNKQWNI